MKALISTAFSSQSGMYSFLRMYLFLGIYLFIPWESLSLYSLGCSYPFSPWCECLGEFWSSAPSRAAQTKRLWANWGTAGMPGKCPRDPGGMSSADKTIAGFMLGAHNCSRGINHIIVEEGTSNQGREALH